MTLLRDPSLLFPSRAAPAPRRADGVGGLISATARPFDGTTKRPFGDQTKRPFGNKTKRPFGATWFWRPDLWTGRTRRLPHPVSGTTLCPGLRMFHDASTPDIALDLPHPGGLRITVGGFDGQFLSLALALPHGITRRPEREHLITLRLICGTAPGTGYARLNLQCGANLHRVTASLDGTGKHLSADLDLQQVPQDTGPVRDGWVDLIFDAPAHKVLDLRDLTLARLPRGRF
ncbi:MAG: DUF6478 family protein [Marinibacterium sp.]|nr:DUF6478 family protein [Marinibacterium sp.]